MVTPHAVLFDLDGTLVDTAPDLIYALNCLRREHMLPELPLSAIRSIVGLGSKKMLKEALSIEETDLNFLTIREQFLALYEKHLADSTQFFPGIEAVLTHLEQRQIPWGIVTNKLTRHTVKLLQALQIDHRPACVICGDTLTQYKPDPAPILYACELLNQEPKHCLYVGDSATDVIASKAAGTASLVALYGYIGREDDPYSWQADAYVEKPLEIIDWIAKYPER